MFPRPRRVTMVDVSTPLSRPSGSAGPPPAPAPGTPPLLRRRSGRFVAGVAGGVADHLEVKVQWVRVAFVLLATLGGAGVLAYGLLWIFVRQEQADVPRTVPQSRSNGVAHP